MSNSLKDRMAALQKEQEQLNARAQKLQNQFNEKERKTIDRRKYVVGGLILKDIESNASVQKYLARLLESSPARDKKLFAELLPPSADGIAE